MGTTIDIVQIGFKLKDNSKAISSKVFADLQRLHELGQIKLDIDDKGVQSKLANIARMLDNQLYRVDLGSISADFLKGLGDVSKTAEQQSASLQKFHDQLVAISSLPTDQLDRLANMQAVDWNKVFHINTDDIERQREQIKQYVTTEEEAVNKLKELQQQEQQLQAQKKANPSLDVDKALQKNYEEQIKYIERIKALKADVQNFDIEAYAKGKGFSLIPQDTINKVQEVNSQLKETVQLIRDIGSTKVASDIGTDTLKSGIIRQRVGSQVDNFLASHSGQGGSNNLGADTQALKGSMDALKGSIDNLQKSVDAQGQAVTNGLTNLNNTTNAVNNTVSGITGSVNDLPGHLGTLNSNISSLTSGINHLNNNNNNNNNNGNNNNNNNNNNGNPPRNNVPPGNNNNGGQGGSNHIIDRYLTDLEREAELQNQILNATTQRERVEERMDLNATRRARARNERQFLTGLYPGGGANSYYTDDQIAYARAQENRIRYNTRLNDYATQAQTMISEQSYNKTNAFRQQLEEVLNIVNQLRGMGDYDLFSPDDLSQAEQLEQRIQQIFTTLNSKTNKDAFQLVPEKTVANMQKTFESYLSNNTKGLKPFESQITQIRNEFERLMASPGDASKQAVDALATSVSHLQTEMARTGNTGKTFWDSFKSRMTNLGTYIGSFMSFYRVISIVKETAATVVDLNSKLVELSKVSNTSIGDLERQFSDFKEISQDIGGTISDTIQATSDWSRNGYNLPEAKELARAAQIYKNVGWGVDINFANESLISTLRGYNMEASQVYEILDKINEVGNNFPIDQKGIGEALTRSAASFQAANTDLSESIALIVGSNSVLQNTTKVGNMWKTNKTVLLYRNVHREYI